MNTNVEEVVTQGLELDFTWRIADPWTLDFRLAFFDVAVDEWSNRYRF